MSIGYLLARAIGYRRAMLGGPITDCPDHLTQGEQEEWRSGWRDGKFFKERKDARNGMGAN
jgi:hypothetical protein